MQPDSKFLDFSSDYVIELANKYGYVYTASTVSSGQKSSLYNNPDTNTKELHKLSMTVDGLECCYYTAIYNDLNFKDLNKAGQQLYQVQVFEVTLPYEVEDLYISSRTNITVTNILGLSNVYFSNSRQITLEGGFNKFFKVFTPEDEELTAFTILAPNIMERLLESASDYDVEFSGNKVYFYQVFKYYTAGVITLNKQAYDNLMEFGFTSAKKIARAGRPAKRPENSVNTPMWKLYGQMNAKKLLDIVGVFSFFTVVFISVVIPLLWPLFALIVTWFLIKWRLLVVKRRKLIDSFSTTHQ